MPKVSLSKQHSCNSDPGAPALSPCGNGEVNKIPKEEVLSNNKLAASCGSFLFVPKSVGVIVASRKWKEITGGRFAAVLKGEEFLHESHCRPWQEKNN